jgi:hypothetical protein
MAIFAEGYTEVEFDSRLIQEIASTRAITIESRKIRGGSTVPRRSEIITTTHTDGVGDLTTHRFLLFDCGGEDLVKSRMIEEYAGLEHAGYEEIICHRDVAPNFTHSEISRLEALLPLYVRTKPITVKFVLSVMEVEAWFLSEHTHFQKIAPTITTAAIAAALKFDPSKDDMRQRIAPGVDLENCYALGGKVYDKFASSPTMDALDYVTVFVETVEKFPHLKVLCEAITSFLAS